MMQKSVRLPFLDNPAEVCVRDNGHTVVIVNKPGELVNISTWVRTGSLNENNEISGISHFLEHLMFKGTPEHPAGEFDRTLEAMGAVVNAATWKDYTFYYVTLPKGKENQNFRKALELHADMMLNALIPDEEIGPVFDYDNESPSEKRERYVVIEEIKMRDDQPWSKTYNNLNSIMYTSHPYKKDVIGTEQIIAQMPRDTIYAYYKERYSPKNFITIIVGGIDTQEAYNAVEEKFVFENTNEALLQEFDKEPEQTEPRIVENKANINTGFAMMGFHGPRASELKESIALDMLSIILGEGKSSRLYQNLIEKPSLPIFNIVGSGQYEMKEGNTFFVQSNFLPDKKDEAVEALKNEIIMLSQEKVTDQEFIKARKKLKIRFAEKSETVSEIGDSIGEFFTVCGDIKYYTDYLPAVESVTKDDILACAKKYLDLNKASISILIPN